MGVSRIDEWSLHSTDRMNTAEVRALPESDMSLSPTSKQYTEK